MELYLLYTQGNQGSDKLLHFVMVTNVRQQTETSTQKYMLTLKLSAHKQTDLCDQRSD